MEEGGGKGGNGNRLPVDAVRAGAAEPKRCGGDLGGGKKAVLRVEAFQSGAGGLAQARVELDARKWFASKFLPKRYGDKAEVEHSGNVGLTVNVLRLTDADNNPAG